MSYARRLLRALDLPRGLPRLYRHDRYWRADIVDALCDRCDTTAEWGDLYEEERLAEAACELTARIRGASSGLRARALYTLATVRRRRGLFAQASRGYRAAWSLVDREMVPLHHVVALAERHAVLLREQGRLHKALDMIRYAKLLGESIDRPTGSAQVIEGIILSYLGDVGGAKERYVGVLNSLDPSEDERLYLAALENLAYLLGAYGSPEDLVEACALMVQARRAIRGIRRTPVRYRLDWSDAVLRRRLGDLRRARRDLLRARRGFARLRMLTDMATVTIELAALEIELDDKNAVPPLLSETLHWIRSIDLDSPVATAYFLSLEHDEPEAMVAELQRRFAATTDPCRWAPVPLSTAADPSG